MLSPTPPAPSALRPLLNIASYDEGLYARVDDERDDLDLEVIGALPEGLRGAFVQANPNPRFPPPGPSHWFDGDGMVHGVSIAEGRASYHNRYVQTAGLKADLEAGRALRAGIMCPFAPGDPMPDKDTANTDLVWHGGKLLALWWLGGQPYQLALPSLDTVGPEDFGGTLGGGLAAHPKVDPRTGELIFFDYNPYRRPFLEVGVVSAAGVCTARVEVETPAPSLFHDIAITEQYTVLLDLPMVWEPERLARGQRRVRFHHDKPGRIGLMPRHGGDVRWFEVPACYVYHTINAWEGVDGDGSPTVTLLACRIDDPIPRVLHKDEPEIPRLEFLRLHPFLYRWTLNLRTGAVRGEQLDDVPTEFPRMNNDRLGVATKRAWHPRIAKAPTLQFDGLIAYDTDTGVGQHHTYGEGQRGGETVFAPRPGATAEDDGWVLTFVNDLREGRTELRVFDAQDVTAGPIARVRLPRRVPMGFHSHWAPSPA
ncbi:MAG: hypothetical protein RL071_768 [Pseudomonadota bacterium]